MTTQRLFVVRVIRDGYVLATSPKEALKSQGAIDKWEEPSTSVAEYPGASLHWHDHALVYGTENDTTFEAARAIHEGAKA